MRTEWSFGEISRLQTRIRDAHCSSKVPTLLLTVLCPAPRGGSLSDHSRLTSVLTVAYMGSKSRTESPGMSKIGAEEEHVTRDTETTFEVKMSKVNFQGAGA